MTHLIEAFNKAKHNRQQAESWLALLNHRDQAGGRFIASAVHSQVKLMICGQDYPGAKNYHESPDCLNEEMAEVVVGELRRLVGIAIERLFAKEEAARAKAKPELEAALAGLQ